MKAQALKHGSILKKKHKTIRFKQLRMLEPHIDLNTKFKTEAKNNVKKEAPRLMNNSIFAKTIQNNRKQRDIWFVTNEKQGINLLFYEGLSV